MRQRRHVGTAIVVVALVSRVTPLSSGSPDAPRLPVGGGSGKGARVRIGVDPRVELMSILFRLAGNPEYNQGRVPRYDAAIDAHFASFRNHPAIQLARTLRETHGVSFDAVMSLAIHVEDATTLKERVPLDRPGVALDARWRGAEARKFLEAARRFVAESRFREFVRSQQTLYDLTRERLRALVEREVDFAWFNRFFGAPAGARFVLIPGLANGGGNYGPKFRARDGSEELYAILGVSAVDAAGLPQFDENVIPTVVHEFDHSYVNPATPKSAAQLERAGSRIYAAVADAMRPQAYGNWQTMINESLVRAAVARYLLAHRGPGAAAEEVHRQRTGAYFLWTGELFDLLGTYERERSRYPTFDAFMPRIVAYFDQLAPRIDDVLRRYDESRPRVVSMTPENGAEAVDPSVTELIFRFDRPMRSTYSVIMVDQGRYPEVLGVGFDESGTVFTMRVRLQPDHRYEFRLNGRFSGSFQSREGIPLKGYSVRFQTGPRQP